MQAAVAAALRGASDRLTTPGVSQVRGGGSSVAAGRARQLGRAGQDGGQWRACMHTNIRHGPRVQSRGWVPARQLHLCRQGRCAPPSAGKPLPILKRHLDGGGARCPLQCVVIVCARSTAGGGRCCGGGSREQGASLWSQSSGTRMDTGAFLARLP